MTAAGPLLAAPRVAVVGCGHWGRNLVRNLHSLGALAAVCDEADGPARAMSKQYNTKLIALEAALADASIEALVLATPVATHARIALRALEADKHVLVEKPLALNVADALRVKEAAEARGRVLMVGHLLQYHPAFLKLRDMIAAGELGRLKYVCSRRLNLGRIRREEDVFWSLAPHDLSMILALTGEAPTSVEANGYCYLNDTIADIADAHLRFPSGVNAQVSVSWLHPYKEHKLIAIGESGMAVFDDGESWPAKLVLYRHRIAWHDGMPEPERAVAQAVTVREDEPLRQECWHFLDCIREGRTPCTDAHEAIGVLRVLDAARSSMVAKRPQTLGKPGTSHFVHESAYADEGCEIGAGTRIWYFSHILKGSRIGRDCSIGQNVMIGPDVIIGDRCKIQNNVSIYNGVTLEDDVFCGPSCVFTNVVNPRAEIERKNEFLPTLVGRGTTIGANATIVCGNRLGQYCFIAAGAVVTRDVPAHALMAGNPARRIGWMSCAGYRLRDDLVCPRTGERYGPDGRDGLTQLQDAEEVA